VGNRHKRLIISTSLMLTAVWSFGCTSLPRRGSSTTRATGTSRVMASASAPETQLLKKLMWPVAHHRITQEFRAAGYGRPHDGIDIAAPKGARIYAPADGHVVYAGHRFHGYGKMIIIEHTDHLSTIFGHLQKLLVQSGDQVHRGSLIGLVGQTGRATAPHLHFEVRWDRAPVNPVEYLP